MEVDYQSSESSEEPFFEPYDSDDEETPDYRGRYGDIVKMDIIWYYKYSVQALVLTSTGLYLDLTFYTHMYDFDSTRPDWDVLDGLEVTVRAKPINFYEPKEKCPHLQARLDDYLNTTPQGELTAEYLYEHIGVLKSCKILNIEHTVFELEGEIDTPEGVKYVTFLTGGDVDMIYRYEPTWAYALSHKNPVNYWDETAMPWCMTPYP